MSEDCHDSNNVPLLCLICGKPIGPGASVTYISGNRSIPETIAHTSCWEQRDHHAAEATVNSAGDRMGRSQFPAPAPGS